MYGFDFIKRGVFVLGRIDKNTYYLNIAKAVSARSTCLRRQYGAVIVKNDEIVSTGYNGSARGDVNCCDVGQCVREQMNVPHGERYELCNAIHAEANALLSAARRDVIGATLYLVGTENGEAIPGIPCAMCSRLIRTSGLAHVYTMQPDGSVKELSDFRNEDEPTCSCGSGGCSCHGES